MRRTLTIAAAAAVLALAGGAAATAQEATKYVVSWQERAGGSPAEYEAAQKRVLGLFQNWQMPESIEVQQFVVSVGDYGGYMVIETADLPAVHRMTSTFAAFQFKVEPVLDVMDAVAEEVKAIEWRESQ